MADFNVLSDADKKILQDLIARSRQLAAARLPPQPDDPTDLAPDVYIALTPPEGIPALSGTSPGAAECDVYQLVGDDLVLSVPNVTVYNLSASDCAADAWVVTVKDKFGAWWVLASGTTDPDGTGTSTPFCLALVHQCSGHVYYLYVTNGVATLSTTPCDDCVDGSKGDPVDHGTVDCSGCTSPSPATLCVTLGPVDNFAFQNFGNRKIIAYPMYNPPGTLVGWSGSATFHGPYLGDFPDTKISVQVSCGSSSVAIAGIHYVGVNEQESWDWIRLSSDDPQVVSCDPFSISASGHVYFTSNPAEVVTQLATATPGPCTPCASNPTVTHTTTTVAGTAATLTITGTGFSTTPSENVVYLSTGTNIGLLFGTCTAATTTSLTVVLNWSLLTITLSDTILAAVSVNGCDSGSAVQVATIGNPLTGGIHIYGVWHGGTGSKPNDHLSAPINPALTIKPGMVAVNVAVLGGGNTAPVVKVNSVALTLAASAYDVGAGAGVAIFQFYASCPGDINYSGAIDCNVYPASFCLFAVQIFNVTGLANNAPDKSSTANGGGGGSTKTIDFINSPHEVTTTTNHGFSTGDVVTISGCTASPGANGTWTITVTGSTKFKLDGATFTEGGSEPSATVAGPSTSTPDTGTTAATTVAAEAVLAAFALGATALGTWTWGGPFVAGGQDEFASSNAFAYALTEGRRILSSTGTVDASLTVTGFTGLAWAGLVVTYK